LYKPERHKYLKTKTQFLLYRKDHEIKTNYNKKYEKRFIHSNLNPRIWFVDSIRFKKNTTINYKYPLKNQEDEVIIQLDKINQNQFFTY
jgi:hypothetical protein